MTEAEHKEILYQEVVVLEEKKRQRNFEEAICKMLSQAKDRVEALEKENLKLKRMFFLAGSTHE